MYTNDIKGNVICNMINDAVKKEIIKSNKKSVHSFLLGLGFNCDIGNKDTYKYPTVIIKKINNEKKEVKQHNEIIIDIYKNRKNGKWTTEYYYNNRSLNDLQLRYERQINKNNVDKLFTCNSYGKIATKKIKEFKQGRLEMYFEKERVLEKRIKKIKKEIDEMSNKRLFYYL